MNVIFVNITTGVPGAYSYEGFPNVLRCAKALSGVKVHVLENLNVSKYYKAVLTSNALKHCALLRWYATRDFIEREHLKPPFFCPDRDDLIISNLELACAPFADSDWGTFHFETHQMAPNLINNLEALQLFCEFANAWKWAPGDNDMGLWTQFGRSGSWRIGDLAEPRNESTFDPGMHQIVKSCPCRQLNDGSKELIWKERRPYFVQPNGQLLRTHTLHCWGTYKTRTSELCKKLGV